MITMCLLHRLEDFLQISTCKILLCYYVKLMEGEVVNNISGEFNLSDHFSVACEDFDGTSKYDI